MTATKKACPVTRQQFSTGARPVQITLDGQAMSAMPKDFSTGSVGWYLSGKATVQVDGVAVPVQVGVTITAIGSKELPA